MLLLSVGYMFLSVAPGDCLMNNLKPITIVSIERKPRIDCSIAKTAVIDDLYDNSKGYSVLSLSTGAL